jgi:NADH-ubiquinone oxidoreductase chain 2
MLVTALFALLTVVALPPLHLSSTLSTRLSALVLASTAALSCHASAGLALGSGVSLYGGLLHATPASYLIDTLLGLIGSLALTPWAPLGTVCSSFTATPASGSISTLYPTNPYWALLTLFSVSGGSVLASSTSMLALYLSLELQSFGVYVLASLYRESETATDAGLTYFLLGGLSSCFILLGTGQLYTVLGVTSLSQVYTLLTPGPLAFSSLVGLSLSFLACGLAFKIAAAPFHQWAPDVYDRVPTVVSSWLQTMPKLAVLGLLLDLTGGLSLSTALSADCGAWVTTLMLISVLSLALGSLLGLAQVRVKRLLAYSTVSHVGFLLLALCAYGSFDAVGSFLFYTIQYSFTSLAALSLLLAFGYSAVRDGQKFLPLTGRAHSTDLELLSELAGRVSTEPMLCLGFASLLFSMAGVPPFAGFFAKQGVLEATLSAHFGGLALLAIVVSVVSASYYLKVVRLLYFSPVEFTISKPLHFEASLSAVHSFSLSLVVLFLSLYMLLPSVFLDSTRVLALSISNT